MSLVRFKTGLEDKKVVESMTVFNSNEVFSIMNSGHWTVQLSI